MWLFSAVAIGIIALAHTAPVRFLLDRMAGDGAVWNMPRGTPPTVYLTYDDGPNPTTTPDLLDVLAGEAVHATFFLIDAHLTDETAPIVQRMFAEGHAVGVHSASRSYMLMSPQTLARTVTDAAARIEQMAGGKPCRAFRPHAGWRGGRMFEGLKQIDYQLVGWGWMLWDFNWMRARTAESTFGRISDRASAGDIIVMHDGDESDPRRDQRHTVEATARLIPALRARGLSFGTICENTTT
jgi:peptidoglycan/xylan/chitin deacetylase (PgdA/CDA1 family)